MDWQKYTLCFRLLSPMHIGYRKVGNLMQTRGYVPGKSLWAALTARLTRDYDNGADGLRYEAIGGAVNQFFRFGYLYPALPKGVTKVQSVNDLKVYYPWEDDGFDYRFLDSYAGTALDYDRQASAEGQLREVEFVRPCARAMPVEDKALQVYLVGDFFAQSKMDPKLTNWRKALSRIQLGGERSYGWGRVQLLDPLMDREIVDATVIEVEKGKHALAHVKTGSTGLLGPVEPLIGWERDNAGSTVKSWRLSSPKICYAPGAIVMRKCTFNIGHYGIWEPSP